MISTLKWESLRPEATLIESYEWNESKNEKPLILSKYITLHMKKYICYIVIFCICDDISADMRNIFRVSSNYPKDNSTLLILYLIEID